jgi:predicted enzyme related to lactoylglutathione lyase
VRFLSCITIDCADPKVLGPFWRDALGWSIAYEGDEGTVITDPQGGRMPAIYLQRVPEPKTGKTRVHLDVWSDDVSAEIDRLISLGGSVVERRTRWDGTVFAVMADPEDTEFCVAAPLPGATPG